MEDRAPARRKPTTSPRLAKPHCEILEGRLLLTAALGGPFVPGGMDAPRVRQEVPSPGHVAEGLSAEELGGGRADAFAAGAIGVYRHEEPSVTMAVADVSGDRRDDFVYANSPTGRVSVDVSGTGPSFLADWGPGVFGSNAAQFADLNGDGVLDLAVSGSAGVQVFPGLGAGRFGPEVNGGRGLAAGAGPAHVAFARLGDSAYRPSSGSEGGPCLDVVVASEGSSEVLVYYGGQGWGFAPGQRLPVGPAPTSVLARDVTADGLTDLVVTSGGGNSVWVLPGLGEGRFDPAARVLPTGGGPVASYVADFDGDGRADLVTLDSGSDSLTYYSDVASPASRPRAIGSGGRRPVAALERDVDGDGASDLIVANHDGRLTLFLGGSSGLTPARTAESPVGHTTALAASTEPGSAWQFYVIGEEDGGAALMSFEPTYTGRVPAPRPPRGAEPPEDQVPADPIPVSNILTALREVEADAVEQALASDPAVAGSPGWTSGAPLGRAGPPTTWAASRPPEEESDLDEEGQQGPRGSEYPPELSRFLLGVDEEKAPVLGPEGGAARMVLPVPAAEEAPAPKSGAEIPGGRDGERHPLEGAGVPEASPEDPEPAWDMMFLLAVNSLAWDVRRQRRRGEARPAGGTRPAGG